MTSSLSSDQSSKASDLTPEQIEQNLKEMRDAQTLPIEFSTFSGGGAKGVAYAGVYRALIDTGLINNMKAFSGSSVGSVLSSLLAFGASPKRVQGLFYEDLTLLLGERVGKLWGANSHGVRFFSRTPMAGYQRLRQEIIEILRDYFNKLNNPDQSLVQLIDKLKETTPEITFADLDILHRHAPDVFKKNVVTATNATKERSGELQIFDENTPDVEIALASTASSCIPGFFSPVSIKVHTDDDLWVDGAVHVNLPAYYFHKNENNQYTNSQPIQTLLFAFAEGNRLETSSIFKSIYHEAPYTPSWFHWFIFDVLAPFLASLTPSFNFSDKHAETYDKIAKDLALRTVIIQTGPIHPLAFDQATMHSRTLYVLGYLNTIDFAVMHQLEQQCEVNKFNASVFYDDVLHHFKSIYSAVLLGAGKDPEKDALLNQFKQRDIANKNRTASSDFWIGGYLDLIKTEALNDFASPAAFAMTRAIELYLGQINAEVLFKETYECSFKLSSYFSISNITGASCYRNASLHRALEGKDMFRLFAEQQRIPHQTRTAAIYDALSQIDLFSCADPGKATNNSTMRFVR